MKKFIMIFFLAITFFLYPLSTFGEEKGTKVVVPEVSAKNTQEEIYKDTPNGGATQQGGVKFVGDIEDIVPSKPDPKKPDPKNPDIKKQNQKSQKPNIVSSKIQKMLPKTGESFNLASIIVGMVLLMIFVLINLKKIKGGDGY